MDNKAKDMLAGEEAYLALVIEKVSEKRSRLLLRIGDAQKELESMNDYFWENYTEFDEYGYEMYDNRMALKTRLTQQEEYTRERKRLDQMLDAPYFGRVDFCYEEEEEPEVYYVGIGNLSDDHGAAAYVYDWRAPVCGLFYDYDRGPAEFTAPAGVMKGEITRKRQYKIRDGRLLFAIETEMNIDDEMLQQTLSENADSKLRSIVTTIQREQNRIIRDSRHRILVVQGCAGSGKTSVALHRIAYLLYHHRESLQAAQVLVLSPNSIFGDYISRILPELGEANICEMTLDDFAYRELAPYGESQDRCDELEKVLRGEESSAAEKQGKDFTKELDGFLLQQEWENVEISDFHYKKYELPAAQISKLFYEQFADVPLLARMGRIADYVIDELETLTGRDMEDEEKEVLRERMNRMYREQDPLKLYQEFLTESGREEELITGTEIPYEDVYPILYLMLSLREQTKRRQIRHIVIDEMQDYSYLQFRILQKLFACPMTILGDRMQTMGEAPCDVMEFLPEIYGKDLFYIDMKKSYRSTCEIMKFANALVGVESFDSVERHGTEPEIFDARSEEEMCGQLLAELQKETRYRTTGVLCRTQEEARQLHQYLQEHQVDAQLLTRDSLKFHTGISVMPFYLAKGLEFDAVHIPHLQDYVTPLEKQALYINATRALHSLKLYQKKSEKRC